MLTQSSTTPCITGLSTDSIDGIMQYLTLPESVAFTQVTPYFSSTFGLKHDPLPTSLDERKSHRCAHRWRKEYAIPSGLEPTELCGIPTDYFKSIEATYPTKGLIKYPDVKITAVRVENLKWQTPFITAELYAQMEEEEIESLTLTPNIMPRGPSIPNNERGLWCPPTVKSLNIESAYHLSSADVLDLLRENIELDELELTSTFPGKMRHSGQFDFALMEEFPDFNDYCGPKTLVLNGIPLSVMTFIFDHTIGVLNLRFKDFDMEGLEHLMVVIRLYGLHPIETLQIESRQRNTHKYSTGIAQLREQLPNVVVSVI